MTIKGIVVFFVGVAIGVGGTLFVGMLNQGGRYDLAEDVPAPAPVSSITRDAAVAAHQERCADLQNSVARYVEERACNDLCGTIDVERKLCFYHAVQIDDFGNRLLSREVESCESLGGTLPPCTASSCYDGICTEDCRVACHFTALTPL